MQTEKEKRGLVILDRSEFESEWEYQTAIRKYLGEPGKRNKNKEKMEVKNDER